MLEDKPKRTEISDLGEFGLIDHLTKNIKLKNPETLMGVGDDTAVIDNEGDVSLLTKDLLVEGVHFDMTYTPLKHLGYKAAIVNLSDIYAMNGTPRQLLVGISVSNRFSLEAIEEIYKGIYLACERYGVDVVGGDTTSSTSGLFISITAIGKAKKENITYRSGTQKDDLICVSGDLGAAYMGLLILEREKQAFKADPNMQPDFKGSDYILERQLKPEARKDIVEMLANYKILPTSMIDISDGLASEIMHLCKNSNTGCRIYEDKIPIDLATLNAADDFKMVPTTVALNGGEDYELLFTIKQEDYEKIKDLKDISVIGHMTAAEAGKSIVTNDGQEIELKAQGWDSFGE